MDFDEDKVDEMTLALLYLVRMNEKYAYRAWKGFDWDTIDRLHEKGYISDPKSKAKSVIMTDDGAELCEKLFRKHFGKGEAEEAEQ